MKIRMLFVFLLLPLTFCKFNKEQKIKIQELNYPAELKIERRADWGWQAPQKASAQHTIKHITIHHGGEYFAPDKDVVAYLRHLQQWSRTEKNWMDIPYHFMIDLQGNIYETRPINYPGDTNTKYNPAGHALICVMGNYEEQVLSAQQLNALINLCAFLADYFHVPAKEIKGHKDYAETLCPGKDLYRYLQDSTIVRRVSKLLQKKEEREP